MCGGGFIRNTAKLFGFDTGQNTTKPYDAEAEQKKASDESAQASNEAIAARNKRKASTVLSSQENTPTQTKTTLGG
ncbi:MULTISPECIES: hypothetical protein [Acinetobacter]|uniref:Uncharacterized protein n=1 Tax=Acinetobacter higginsii TaxID=70347 RepID=N9RDX6_9GAMM|nr:MULTISPECIES: hypothetical protein [Acinetobacter]ENX56169.1 hypothetical protein F902_03266 [Acinetobacter higginsii]